MLHIVTDSNCDFMGVVRIDDKLLDQVQKWLEENGNKYKHPTMSAFINNAVYDKIQQLKEQKKRVSK